MLSRGEGSSNASQIQAAAEPAAGEHPNTVVQLSRELGFELAWQGFRNDGVYEAIFNPRWEPNKKLEEAASEFYRRFANSPAQVAGDLELSAELKEHLRQILPGHMVPASIIMVPSWPLTANGKVDRKALPTPTQELHESYREPRTPDEDLLCQMFGEVL